METLTLCGYLLWTRVIVQNVPDHLDLWSLGWGLLHAPRQPTHTRWMGCFSGMGEEGNVLFKGFWDALGFTDLA